MDREVQSGVAKQIKAASERGIRICVASVPHRADDVVRGNPELRGRTTNIDIAPWRPTELSEIARQGFNALNATIPNSTVERFSEEAAGSPQLMQSICLQTCFALGHRERLDEHSDLEVPDERLAQILEETSTKTDYSSLVTNMHEGPKIRGQERKEFDLQDGSRGDVYRAVLLAIASNPPKSTFRYNDLMGAYVKCARKTRRRRPAGMFPDFEVRRPIRPNHAHRRMGRLN